MTNRSLQELRQLKNEKPQLISKIDKIQKVLSQFQNENDMLKRQIKQIITSTNSSAHASHKSLAPHIAPETANDNAGPNGSAKVSMMHLFPPSQVLGSSTTQHLLGLPTPHDDAVSRNSQEHIRSENTKQTNPPAPAHNFGCLQNLFGESFDGRSQQTQARDIKGGIGYQTALQTSQTGL